jgi:hypothetical protein
MQIYMGALTPMFNNYDVSVIAPLALLGYTCYTAQTARSGNNKAQSCLFALFNIQ